MVCLLCNIPHSLTLDDLVSKNLYLVSLDVKVCFESGSACAVSIPVLSESKLPKTSCNWTAGLQGKFSVAIHCTRKTCCIYLYYSVLSKFSTKILPTDFLNMQLIDTLNMQIRIANISGIQMLVSCWFP